MSKDHKIISVMGSYEAEKEGVYDGLPVAEVEGDRDEDDMAAFGKRQQLKVRLCHGQGIRRADIE